MHDETLTAALAYARVGLPVFPIWAPEGANGCTCGTESCIKKGTQGKHPATPNGVKDATTDTECILGWFSPDGPERNLAVATGRYADGTGTIVVDIDGDAGEDTIDWLERNDHELPVTKTSYTGRREGGRHLWYLYPEDPDIRIITKAAALGRNVDIKADHGYVVVPPSLHASGKQYTWATGPDIVRQVLPEWTVQLLARRTTRDAALEGVVASDGIFEQGDGSTSPWGGAALRNICEEMRDTPEGARNDTLNLLGFKVGQRIQSGHIEESEGYAALLDAAEASGLTTREADDVLRRAISAGKLKPAGPAHTELPANWNPQDPNADVARTLDSQQADEDDDDEWEPAGPPPTAAAAKWERPEVQVNNVQIDELAEMTVRLLVATNLTAGAPTDYVNDGRLQQLQIIQRSDGSQRLALIPYTADSLRFRIGAVATWVKRIQVKDPDNPEPGATITKTTNVFVPRDLAVHVLNAGMWKDIDVIEGVIDSPAIRKDGTVITKVGFDKATSLFFAPTDDELHLIDPAEAPTSQDVEASTALVWEAIRDFPFTSQADRANTFALLLTPIVRPAIEGPTPLAVIRAPQSGTGKSLLIDTIATIITGRAAEMTAIPRSDEEWEKKLLAQLMRRPILTVFDNATTKLESGELCQTLTEREHLGRILGQSTMATVPVRTAWVVTGNQIKMSDEIARRTYSIALDAKTSAPEKRAASTFLHPLLVPWVKSRRKDLLQALIIIARSWWANGCPAPDTPAPSMGSYEEWDRIIGGILANAGIEGFRANAAAVAEDADEETANTIGILEFLYASPLCGPGTEFTASQLPDLISYGTRDPQTNLPTGGVLELLPTRMGRHIGHDTFTRALSDWFASIKGRRFGPNQIRIERSERKINNKAVWRIQVETS